MCMLLSRTVCNANVYLRGDELLSLFPCEKLVKRWKGLRLIGPSPRLNLQLPQCSLINASLFPLPCLKETHSLSLWMFLCMIVFSVSAVLFKCSGVFVDDVCHCVCVSVSECVVSDRGPNEVACESPARTAEAHGFPASHPAGVRVQARFKFGLERRYPWIHRGAAG